MTELTKKKILWEDGDDNETRELYKSTVGGGINIIKSRTLTTKRFKKKFFKRQIQFKIEKNIFEAKNRIKKVESSGDYTMISNYNILTIVKNILEIDREVINIEFKSEIQDFIIRPNEKDIICIFKNSFYLKLVDFNGEVVDIVKNFNEKGFTKILFVDNMIYLLGEMLSVVNIDLGIELQLNYKLRDFTVLGKLIYALLENNDILVFDGLQIIKKMSLSDKFAIQKIFCYEKIYLACLNSIKIYDSELKFIKERSLPFETEHICKVGDLLYLCAGNRQTLRIMQNDICLPNFPTSSMFFPKISSLSSGSYLLYSSSNHISYIGTT